MKRSPIGGRSSKGELPQRASHLLRSFRSLSADDREILVDLIPGIVDTVLHHLLWTAEQQSDLQLGIKTDHGIESLREISDGLPGELYTDEGWIARFSKEDRYL